MLTKLLLTLFVFSISVSVLSTPINADCLASSKMSNEAAKNQGLCIHDEKETSAAKSQQYYADSVTKEALAHIRMSKRQPSALESLMAMFFIPGLILLWFSRFTKSNK
jgi:hypothetical protein